MDAVTIKMESDEAEEQNEEEMELDTFKIVTKPSAHLQSEDICFQPIVKRESSEDVSCNEPIIKSENIEDVSCNEPIIKSENIEDGLEESHVDDPLFFTDSSSSSGEDDEEKHETIPVPQRVLSDDRCLICNELLVEDDRVMVKQKGLRTLIKFSELRADGLSQIFADVEQICLHTSCRKKYTNAKVKFNTLSTLHRPRHHSPDSRSADGFDFKEKCFICTDDFNIDLYCQSTKCSVTQKAKKETIMEALVNNNSTANEMILKRIENVDLLEVKASYHIDCYKDLTRPLLLTKKGSKRGRPKDESITLAMELIFNYIEKSGDSQFDIEELRDIIPKNVNAPENRTVLKRLWLHYRGRIVFHKIPERTDPLISIKDSAENVLSKSWHSEKINSEHDERLRIVKKAADIIREDIQVKLYQNSQYPSPQEFMKNAKNDVPESLNVFLKTLFGSQASSQETRTKRLSIAHAIIALLRPKKFISSILTALAVTLKNKFSSKYLLNILNKLGFCASYAEASTFETSAMRCCDKNKSKFVQYVFENFDVNIDSTDGELKFNLMGGIECKTPKKETLSTQDIPRVAILSKAEVFRAIDPVPFKISYKRKKGLQNLKTKMIEMDKDILPTLIDMLWLYGKCKNISNVDYWNGFMQAKQMNDVNRSSQITEIKALPFMNSSHYNNYNTLNTALITAAQKTKQNKQLTTIVTLGEPQYMEAREILALTTDPILKNVIIRMGGFNILISFIGAIGFIMAGSRIKELWSTVYPSNFVNDMLTGHEVSKAVQAHLLTHLVLGKIITNDLSLNDVEIDEVENFLSSHNTTISNDDLQHDYFKSVQQKFHCKLIEIQERSRTAKLWIQYFRMVCLLKQFIEAEKSSNWALHLDTLKKMLPFFLASGYFNYAKSIHIYLQDMEMLQNTMTPEEYTKFTSEGLFTICRTEKFWSGVWTDLAMEQSLMKTMKYCRRSTVETKMTDSIFERKVLSMNAVRGVEESLESFCEIEPNIYNIHKDIAATKIEEENADVVKLSEWFKKNQVLESTQGIHSLGSAGIEDDIDNINSQDAFEVGRNILSKKVGCNFMELNYSRKDKVVPFSLMKFPFQSIFTFNEILSDPLTIFKRISFLKIDDEQMKENFKYELAPYPLSLFDENGMLTTEKSLAYELFVPLENIDISERNVFYVIDGDHLMHTVIWNKGQTFEDICIGTTEYVKQHYNTNCIVIFEKYSGNTEQISTKISERMRQTGRTSTEVIINSKTLLTTNQEEFLSNIKNKSILIAMIHEHFLQNDIKVILHEGDVTPHIVKSALSLASSNDAVVIIGDDVNLLILLTAFASNDNENVFFIKNAKDTLSIYNGFCLKYESLKEYILELHAFSGCVTTSALYNISKNRFFRIIGELDHSRDILEIFKSDNVTRESVKMAGEQLISILHSGDVNACPDYLRYQKFSRSLFKNAFNFSCLPPTKAAVHQHALRVYHQVQSWQDNPLNPLEYGWMIRNGVLVPVSTEAKAAPDDLLKIIFCKCNTCDSQCSCRESGLKCVDVCKNCKGNSCYNSSTTRLYEREEIDNEDYLLCTDKKQNSGSKKRRVDR